MTLQTLTPPSGDGLALSPRLDERALSKLKWRCRRGLLENDLFVTRYFQDYEADLTVFQAQGVERLMDLSDNDLMDLLLARQEPEGELDVPEVRQVLADMRRLGGKPLD